MKAKELRKLTNEELENTLKELKEYLFKEYAHINSGGRPENPGKIRETKKTIARIKTILAERARSGKNNE